MEQIAAVSHGDDRQRVRRAGRANRRAFERIESDVDFVPLAMAVSIFLRQPDLLTDVEHRRFVALAFADHDRAVDRQRIESFAHGVDRRLVRGFFIAASGPARAIQRRRFRYTNSLQC